MHSRELHFFIFLALGVCSPLQAFSQSDSLHGRTFKPSSPFSVALETLQKQIGYSFQSIGLLRRAMTHASYSEENNRALSVLGASVIETSLSLRSLSNNIEISAKYLNRRISEISKVEASCDLDGTRLGLQKVVRVSPKTNSSTPAVVCGALRAIVGAIAVDSGKSDDAGNIFWNVHGSDTGNALAIIRRSSRWTRGVRQAYMRCTELIEACCRWKSRRCIGTSRRCTIPTHCIHNSTIVI